MIKDILVFIVGKLKGHSYICDMCQDSEQNYMTIGIIDYIRNQKNNCHYCKWCWSYINLKHFNCKCGNKSTLRSEHQDYLTCMNCYKLVRSTI